MAEKQTIRRGSFHRSIVRRGNVALSEPLALAHIVLSIYICFSAQASIILQQKNTHTHTHKHAISASRPPGFSGCSNRHTEEKKKNAMCEKNNPSQGMVSIGSNKRTYNKVTMQFQTMEGKRLMGKQNTITTTTARMIQTWPTSNKNGQNRQAQWDRAHTTTMAERYLSTCSSTAARPHLLMAHLVALLIRNVSPRHGDVQPDESKQSSTVGERATEV